MEKGHEVALLVMFDTANPAFQQTCSEGSVVRLASRRR